MIVYQLLRGHVFSFLGVNTLGEDRVIVLYLTL